MSLAGVVMRGARCRPPVRHMIPLTMIINGTQTAAVTAFNVAADTNRSSLTEFARHAVRLHSEQHTAVGVYDLMTGTKRKGTSSTTLASKLAGVGVLTTCYGHGSYVMQSRLEEAADLEANYPLAISTFWPGNPDDGRTTELLTVGTAGRDEKSFEGTTANFWATRAPGDAVVVVVDTTTTATRTGTHCLAVTRGATAGQMVVSTGVLTTTAHVATPGLLVTGSVWVKAATTGRVCQIELVWRDSAAVAIGTATVGSSLTDSATWQQLFITDTAPAGTAYVTLQVRWLGPPSAGETHFLDDASLAGTAARLQIGVNSTAASVQVYASALLKPDASLPDTWPWIGPRAGDVTPSSTTAVSVSSASCIHPIRIGDEWMAVTGAPTLSAGIVTIPVRRGMWGTTATAHLAGDKVLSPAYVGSVNEGADATFAGSPAVNDSTKCLRYVINLENRLDQPQRARGPEWLAKRRLMEYLEYDLPTNSGTVPQSSAPSAWTGYTAGVLGITGSHLDITGTSFYNVADNSGYDVRPWSPVGVPSVGLPPDSLMTFAALAACQTSKVQDLRTVWAGYGLSSSWYVVGNNLAAQGNDGDAGRYSIGDAGQVDVMSFEFWMNNPTSGKAQKQRDQWMYCCLNDQGVVIWAKAGQNGIIGTPWDAPPTGTITTADLRAYRLWCLGHFLMGWRGSLKQQFMSEWGLTPVTALEPEFLTDLGKARANYPTWADIPQAATGVLRRDFTLGSVLLNTTGAPVTITLDRPMGDVSQAVAPYVETSLPRVGSISVPAYGARLLYAP